MCKAFEDHYQSGVREGRREGREAGLREGEQRGRIYGQICAKQQTTRNLLAMGMGAEQIAQAVGESTDVISDWLKTEN